VAPPSDDLRVYERAATPDGVRRRRERTARAAEAAAAASVQPPFVPPGRDRPLAAASEGPRGGSGHVGGSAAVPPTALPDVLRDVRALLRREWPGTGVCVRVDPEDLLLVTFLRAKVQDRRKELSDFMNRLAAEHGMHHHHHRHTT
jgi:hypothetical protein